MRLFWLALVGLVSGTVQAETYIVGAQKMEFGQTGGAPLSWVSCVEDCRSGEERNAEWFGNDDGSMQWAVPDDSAATTELRNTEFAVTASNDGDATLLIARSLSDVAGGPVTIQYRLPGQGHSVDISVSSAVPLRLELATGESLVPEQLAGFGEMYSTVRSVLFFDGDIEHFEFDEAPEVIRTPETGSWFGVRNRYWLWFAHTGANTGVMASESDVNRPVIAIDVTEGKISLYSGPTELQALRAAGSGELSGVLFAAIWDWLRAISFGLMYLLNWLYGLVGNYGIAIVLLSLTVKILMHPLTIIAERWQAQVNVITSAMKPQLDAIKQNYKGEEAHNKVLAVYKEHNVTPFYTLRSLFGFLIQIPIFIGAFDMLAENFVLGQASFLWISDLAKPDNFAALPFTLPFFGGYLNLLPFAMTVLTILSAIVQEEADLTPDLMKQQRLKLFAMAGIFFLLFYTFPAGMVLYWTANNLFHLLKILPARLMNRGKE